MKKANLRNNKISDKSVKLIKSLLNIKNLSLENLNLCDNEFGTDGIESITVLVQVVAAVRDAFVAVAVPVDVSRVTDLVGLAVGVSVASAKVLGASMATNGVGSRTVVVCGTAWATTQVK